jgi:hypothetical protein
LSGSAPLTSTRNYRGVEALDDPPPLPALPGIFNAGTVPAGEQEKPTLLTAGDLVFLRALYSTNLEQPLFLEQSDIQANMEHQFRAR